MITSRRGRRANYFSDEKGVDDFHQAFVNLLAQIQKESFSKYLSPENTHRFKHGGQWAHPAAPDVPPGDMQAHSAQTEISFDRLVNHDLTVVDQVLRQLSESMERQFTQMMYSTMSAAAESVGNTVDAGALSSPREAFAQALEKMQFSANKFSEVTLPEMHMAPETAKAFRASVDEAPPEFHQRVEAIKARKMAEALDREVQRKARFIRYGDTE